MKRQVGLLAALAVTLCACWWVSQSDTETTSTPVASSSVPAGAAKQRKPLSEALPELHAALTAPTHDVQVPLGEAMPPLADAPNTDESVVNLFAALPPPATLSEAMAATGPVNPYTYAGRLLQEDRWLVFLTDGQQQYVVREGDRFAEGWRVTRLDQHTLVLQHAGERFEMMLENGGVL